MFCYSEAEKENYHDYDPLVICFTYLDRIDLVKDSKTLVRGVMKALPWA